MAWAIHHGIDLILLVALPAVAILVVRRRRRWLAATAPLFDPGSAAHGTFAWGRPRLVANYHGLLAIADSGASELTLQFPPGASSPIGFQIRRKPSKWETVRQGLPLLALGCLFAFSAPGNLNSAVCLLFTLLAWAMPVPVIPPLNRNFRAHIDMHGGEALEYSSPMPDALQRQLQHPACAALLLRLFTHSGVTSVKTASAVGTALRLTISLQPGSFRRSSHGPLAQLLSDQQRFGQSLIACEG